MSEKVLHMIGNAHVDPVWLWQWQEGFAEVVATFRSALDRVAEYDDFIFTCSSAAFYSWVEENNPEMFEEIRQRVREGRWKIVGGWWIQPDCNLPSGESFVRQGLSGQRYFRRAFGISATVGYNVDSFGHNAMLPQILAKMGLRRYVFMRPNHDEMSLPAPTFWWEAPDGSRVLTFRIPFTYTTWGAELSDHIEKCAAMLQGDTSQLLCFYGVGNHGGGPTRENIESIHAAQERSETTIVMSSPEAFFEWIEAAKGELPVVRTELQHHARGCYSAYSEIKRLNRRAEVQLLNAESFEVLASALTAYLPRRETGRAWLGLLFNQFHDILAGTSIEPAYDDAREQIGEVLSIASRSIASALHAITWAIGIPVAGGTKPIVVFNPNPFEVSEAVEIELLHDGQVDASAFRETDEVVDEAARPVAFQLVQSLATAAFRTRLCFDCRVPPFGYRVYRVQPTKGATSGNPAAWGTSTGEGWIENEYLRVEIDPESGCIRRLFDRKNGVEILARPGSYAAVFRDESDTWSHGVATFGATIGEFGGASVRLIESGPVRSVIRSESSFGGSKLVQDFVLSSSAPFVDVRVRLDWREPQCLLKLQLPVGLSHCTATYEIPFGTAVREANGEEEPGLTWIDLSGTRTDGGVYGLGLANTAKYSYSVEREAMSLTIVRSPIFAHHHPRLPDPTIDYRYTDQGEQAFSYRLVPHRGDWREGRVIDFAASLNNPLIPVQTTFHPGPLPQVMEGIRIDRPNLTVCALKLAEEGDDMILRCRETHGVDCEAHIRLDGCGVEIRTHFAHYELKTFRIPRRSPGAYWEVDLLEDAL